ncbi:restriction endonuclease subunit S [Empedobacter brevis]|uniref:restriction endonuclease subunit S n=1 Tax=Empedobacter brevis TaxID=247 RepID=UPI003341302E
MVETNFKQTDLGKIPKDWDIAVLQDNITLKARIGWQGLTTAEYRENGDYYLITGTDFKNGYIDWKNCVFVDKIRYDQDRNIQVKEKDILVTKDGTIGKVAYIDSISKPTTLNSGVFVLRILNEKLDSRFIYYILMSFYFDNFLKQITAGSTITHLYQKDFIHFNFIVPPLPEQKAIAEVLSDTDHWITSLEYLIAKKQLIKQGAMQKLLTPKEDWEVKKLGEVCEILNNLRIPIKESEREKGNIPYYGANGIQDFVNGYTHDGENVLLAEDGASDLNNYPVNYTMGKIWVNNHAHVLRGKNKILKTRFLSYLLKSIDFNNVLVGGTRAKLNKSVLENVEIIFPTLSKQEHIATILSDMDAEIETLEQKLTKAKQVKQGLMQKLLTGRIRLV